MKLPLNVTMPSITLPFGKGRTDESFENAPEANPGFEPSGPALSTRTKLIAGTALAVFGIGFVMQNVFGSNAPLEQAGQTSLKAPLVTVSNVEPTAAENDADNAENAVRPVQSAMAGGLLPMQGQTAPMQAAATEANDRIEVLADMPSDAAEPAPLAVKEPIQTAAYDAVDPDLPSEESVPLLTCDIALTAEAAPAAMVDLVLNAPCLPNERMTVHHNGMMFTAVTDADGGQNLRVPALSENAVYIVSFTNGEGAVTQIDVPTLNAFDRVVVQWRGKTGLGVHALEFGAEYFSDGHIHVETAGDVAATTQGKSGFLMRYGADAGPEALMAEVYTFPSGTTGKSGQISLSVEAEVTKSNCSTQVEAQTLQMHPQQALKSQDLELFMPDCDAVGDFLVLKNLLEDLKVASN